MATYEVGGLTANRYFQRFRQNGKWYLQLFLGICLSNIFVFGHLGEPSSYKVESIYSFEGNPDHLFDNVVRMIHEHDATANDIVNTFMNQKDPVGIYFACASMLCPIFHSQANKRSFVEETVLLRVIHPIWNCLHPSDQPNHADLLQFGQEVPECYDEGLDIVAVGVSTESQLAVQNANLAFKKFEASVRSVKIELEWPLAERKARDVFEQHRVLISAFSSMRTACQENASGVNFCKEIPISRTDLANMQGNLKMVAETTRINVEDTRQTFMGFVLKMLSSAILGVAITIGIHALASLFHRDRDPPVEAFTGHGPTTPSA